MNIDYKFLEQQAEKQKIALENYHVTLNEDLKHQRNELKFLHSIDEFISVPQEKIQEAIKFYTDIGIQLEKTLGVKIETYPQGSASTKTIIRSVTNEDFDIDAVSEISDYTSDHSAIDFFENVGESLRNIAENYQKIEIEKKKRCWRVNLIGSGFYIDLIPAIPLRKEDSLNENIRSFNYTNKYNSNLILIVNEPTKEWQSSNPQGFTQWLQDCNKLSRELIQNKPMQINNIIANESVAGVPTQDISIDDYLLLTIRLIKRHRDMMVRRNKLAKDYKPISVIFCTLVGQTIQAMVENNRKYQDYYEFLDDLVFKLPYMIGEDTNGNALIPNPTAPDENFADRWPEDRGARKSAFQNWHKDISQILKNITEVSLEDSFKILTEAFGTTDLKFDSSERKVILLEQKNAITKSIPRTANKIVPADGLA